MSLDTALELVFAVIILAAAWYSLRKIQKRNDEINRAANERNKRKEEAAERSRIYEENYQREGKALKKRVLDDLKAIGRGEKVRLDPETLRAVKALKIRQGEHPETVAAWAPLIDDLNAEIWDAKAAPLDWYTVLTGTGSQMSVLPALKSNTPFDAERDFDAISLLGTTPYVLLVNSSVPAKTLPELIALLQANPGKFNHSTSGFGSLPHLAGEMFKRMAKVEMTHVPYPGNSPATTAAVSGVVQITFDSPISSLPYVQAGTFRALAVANAQPIDAFPGVPTLGSVLPGFLAESWLCLYVAAGAPQAIVERLREATDQAIQRPQFLTTAKTGGFDVPRLSAEEMAKFLRDDAARWREVTKSANIVVE
jgi:tripartite-type tricarboxylate transporter receptor subunit TctC